MDYKQAESRYRILQAQRGAGEMDDETFRFETAKLLLQDDRGVLWMLDAEQGTWICNRGEGWEPGDPRLEPPPPKAPGVEHRPRRRAARWLALGMTLLSLLVLAGILVLWQGALAVPWNPFLPTPAPDTQVKIIIASPADGSQVALGQEIAIESTIDAMPDLQDVERVVLEVNGKKVNTLAVQPQTQAHDGSFPLSQPWRPESAGEYRVVVMVFSTENQVLATAAVTLQVATPDEVLAEPACVPDASFVADVTIPPDTAFPPSVRMDKVWQVRNSGSCAWGVGYRLVQLAGSGLISPDTVPVPPTAAGEAVDLAVTLWAPAEVGAYANLWRLRSPEGDLFGPTLPLTIHVEVLAQKDLPPKGPVDLVATVDTDGTDAAVVGVRTRPPKVRLTWSDQSDNEDAFRIYRADLEASIGLAPAGAEQLVDEEVACGNTYLYSIVAFNAAGTSAESASAEVTLPPCAPADEPPSLSLTVVPTQVRADEPFALVFQASDDMGLNLVVVWGVETEDPVLNSGRAFTCTGTLCAGGWPLTWTQPTSIPLTLVAVALDSSGKKSEPAWLTFTILAPRLITPRIPITDSVLITDQALITDGDLITGRVPITE